MYTPGKHYDIVSELSKNNYVTMIYGIEPTKENCEKIRKAINESFKGAKENA